MNYIITWDNTGILNILPYNSGQIYTSQKHLVTTLKEAEIALGALGIDTTKITEYSI